MAKSKGAKGSKTLGVGCAVLFAIPFASVGVFMAWAVISSVAEYLAMQQWVETPAVITRAELQVNHDEGATYRALADYQYEFGGQKFQGSRVGISSGTDNIGNFHQRVHHELETHQTTGQPFRCYVNPERPEQSILYRELRWEMIAFYDLFVLTFGGFGLGMLLGSLLVGRAERRRAARAVEYPDEPWLWRDDWAANEIEPSNKLAFTALVTVTLFWNFITLPLWWLLPPQLARGNYAALIAAILPGIGLILIWSAYRMWQPYRKYGRCVFRMTKPGAVIGSELSGVIETSRPVECEEFQVVLLCQKKISDGEDSKTIEVSRREEMVPNSNGDSWGDTGSSIPVRFAVPDDCRPTGEADDGTILWKLIAKSDNPQNDFKVEFEVPVFGAPVARELSGESSE